MKTCPFCAEEIRDEAIKCKHCGSTVGEKPMDRVTAVATDKAKITLPKNMRRFWLGILGGIFFALLTLIIMANTPEPRKNPRNSEDAWQPLLGISFLFASVIFFIMAFLRNFPCSFCRRTMTTWLFFRDAEVCRRCKVRHIIDWEEPVSLKSRDPKKLTPDLPDNPPANRSVTPKLNVEVHQTTESAVANPSDSGTRNEDAFCYLCGKRLRAEEQASRICQDCRR